MSEKKSFKRLIIFTIAATMCLVTISFLPTASAADIYVPGDYSSIQDAIDNANPGDTIYVAAGTYHENLASWKDMEITKSLNLIGAGSGSTIVEFRQVQNGMEIRGTDLTILIEGFTFTKIPGNTYASNFNFKIAETTSSFINLTLRDVEVAYAQGPNVNLGSNGIFDKVFIENCNFHHAGTWGLYSQGNVLDMEVTDSHFDNNGLVDASHGIGFDLSSSSGHSNIHVSGGTFNDNTMKGINIVKTNNAIFEDVEANNNGDHGVCLWEWVDTSQNLIFNNPSLIGNGLDGFLIGAQTGTTVSSVSIDQGILQGNGRAGLFIYNMGGTIQNIGINNANIIGNTNWGVYTNTATVVDAECNWWDSTSGPTHASNGYNIGLQGQPVSNNVDWCPYLDDSYPSGICWGPVQNTRTLEYFCTIQSGIDDTDTIDGDTLTVAPGTYIETAASYCDINLNKDVSLIGAGSGSTIIELTQGKSEGLQITGTNPSDITIEGMTFTYQSGSTNAAKRALRVFSDLNSLT
jgi:hypothetical protein